MKVRVKYTEPVQHSLSGKVVREASSVAQALCCLSSSIRSLGQFYFLRIHYFNILITKEEYPKVFKRNFFLPSRLLHF